VTEHFVLAINQGDATTFQKFTQLGNAVEALLNLAPPASRCLQDVTDILADEHDICAVICRVKPDGTLKPISNLCEEVAGTATPLATSNCK
jgi:hypothetical protein